MTLDIDLEFVLCVCADQVLEPQGFATSVFLSKNSEARIKTKFSVTG